MSDKETSATRQHIGGGGQHHTRCFHAGVYSTSTFSKEHTIQLYLIRHGESEANVDKSVFLSKPDHAHELTAKGREMATGAAEFLKTHLKEHLQECGGERGDHHVRMWVSPFERARQTAEELLKVLNTKDECLVDSVRESVFLAEQDFGLMEGTTGSGALPPPERILGDNERNKLKSQYQGNFWARYPGGESTFDVTARLSGLISEINAGVVVPDPKRSPIKTVIVVAHGSTLKALAGSWCRLSPEWVSTAPSPPNCSVQLIQNRTLHGYIFAGYCKGGEEEEPLKMATTPTLAEDPRNAFWDALLNPTT